MAAELNPTGMFSLSPMSLTDTEGPSDEGSFDKALKVCEEITDPEMQKKCYMMLRNGKGIFQGYDYFKEKKDKGWDFGIGDGGTMNVNPFKDDFLNFKWKF